MEIGLDWKCGGKVNKRQKRNQVTCLKKKREEAPAFLNGGVATQKWVMQLFYVGFMIKKKNVGSKDSTKLRSAADHRLPVVSANL